MTKDELYDKLIAMLPVENKDDKEFRVLLSDCFRTYQRYLDDTPEVEMEVKKEVTHICETLKEIVKAQYKVCIHKLLVNCPISSMVHLVIKD